MKLPSFAQIGYWSKLRAGVALVFSLQILALCLCAPPAVDEHDCCPPESLGLNVAGPSADAARNCCSEAPGLRAAARMSERDATAIRTLQATLVHAGPVRSEAPAQPHHTSRAASGGVAPSHRSPILRV